MAPTELRNSVLPSGRARPTNVAAMAPLPPGLFSTSTGCFSSFSSCEATMRASESAGPPAGNATTRLVLDCACAPARSEEHTSELQSLMRISYAVFCLKKKNIYKKNEHSNYNTQEQSM